MIQRKRHVEESSIYFCSAVPTLKSSWVYETLKEGCMFVSPSTSSREVKLTKPEFWEACASATGKSSGVWKGQVQLDCRVPYQGRGNRAWAQRMHLTHQGKIHCCSLLKANQSKWLHKASAMIPKHSSLVSLQLREVDHSCATGKNNP